MKTHQNSSAALYKQKGWFCLMVWLFVCFVGSAIAVPPVLVSLKDPVIAPLVGGNGDSVSPVLTPDGRFVVFSSSARDLTVGDNDYLGLDVFLRDRANGTTTLVSENVLGSGGNGDSDFASVSTNGQYVVFQSTASDIAAGDTNGASDVFVNDVLNGAIYTISAATNGFPGNSASTAPVITPDGRYVAFISAANNLVAGDTNHIPDVFVRDVLNGTTVCASIGAAPTSGNTNAVMGAPVITPDGRFVTFFSTARGLVNGVLGTSMGEIYVRDLVNNKTIWASTNAIPLVQATIPYLLVPIPSHPVISDNGQYIAFKCGWTNNLVAPPLNTRGSSLILQYDTVARTTTIISTNGNPPAGVGDDAIGPVMTPDGRFVAFATRETNGAVFCFAVRVWDRTTGSNVLASPTLTGGVPVGSSSEAPAMTPDGRFVAFLSNATNLINATISNSFHLYLRDLQSGTTSLVDADTNGLGSTYCYGLPSMSADGRLVAFDDQDGGLVPSDNNKAEDVFVRDMMQGTTELVSQHGSGVTSFAGDWHSVSSAFSVSDDGRWMAFASLADNLVENDINGAPDIFVHDLLTGTNILVSVGNAGTNAGTYLVPPVMSRNGRYVAFVSSSTNLVAGITNFFGNIFMRDLQTATTTVVSVNTNGNSGGNGEAAAPAMSEDGRYVAFLSKATDLATNLPVFFISTYLRDLNSGVTVALTTSNASLTIGPSITPDGHYVAYIAGTADSGKLHVWDTQSGANIYTNTVAATGVAICPTGTRVLYAVSNAMVVSDFLANTDVVSIPAHHALMRDSRPWSADGRYFVFVTDTNGVAGDNNGTNDVYLYDLQSSTLSLVSINASHTGSGDQRSDSPVISGDGRFVAYRSFATDLTSGSTNVPNIFVFDQTTGSNTLVSPGMPDWSKYTDNRRPAINTNGSVVLFQGLNTGLNAHDQNRSSDVFATTSDSDGDGIPDFWTQYYFGHPTGQAGDLSRSGDDADGDGLSNLQEFLTGTNPTNAASAFQLAIAPGLNGTNSTVLSWPATPGQTYHIQYKNNFSDAMWTDAAVQIFFAGNQAYVIVPTDQPNRFYRIVGGN